MEWDGTMIPVPASSGKSVKIVLKRKKLSERAAANQAETNKQAAEAGAPFVDT